MPASLMNDVPESPEERRQRRRARRWKRRARMVGPFLGLPLLVGTLALSVDLIEYSPTPERERLSDRPIPVERLKKSKQMASERPSAVAAPVIDSTLPTTGALDLDVSFEPGDSIALEREFAPPTPPYALRNRR